MGVDLTATINQTIARIDTVTGSQVFYVSFTATGTGDASGNQVVMKMNGLKMDNQYLAFESIDVGCSAAGGNLYTVALAQAYCDDIGLVQGNMCVANGPVTEVAQGQAQAFRGTLQFKRQFYIGHVKASTSDTWCYVLMPNVNLATYVMTVRCIATNYPR